MKTLSLIFTLLISIHSMADSASLEKCVSELSNQTFEIVNSTVGLKSVKQLEPFPDLSYSLCITKRNLGDGMSFSQINNSIYKTLFHAGIDVFGADNTVLRTWVKMKAPHLLSGKSSTDVQTQIDVAQ